MSKYAEWRARVSAEVRSAFNIPGDIKPGPQLSQCRLLRASIDEALRLSPSFGSALWREVESAGLRVDDLYIPPGCEVGVSIYALQHHEAYFKDRYTFDPDRWLDGSASRQAFMPFSRGPRSCVGKSLAMHELTLGAAHLLWRFDLEEDVQRTMANPLPSDRMEKEYALYEHVTGARTGPFIKWKPAQRYSAA